MNRFKKNTGQIIIPALLFGVIAIIIITALVSWGSLNLKMARNLVERERALQIAEAGNEYYRWHLAHTANDYQDGTGTAGPYTHDFLNKDGSKIGTFTLEISPPSVGSTQVKIKSQGNILSNLSISRKVETLLAIPTIAKYAIVSNGDVRFGIGTEVYGPIQSNGGIRFDGLAHNIVSSARQTYTDPDSPKDSAFGVHTHVDPADPTIPPSPLPNPSVPLRTDVFEAGRKFPVPAIDFSGLTPDLQEMKTDAQNSGYYQANSGSKGYHIVLHPENDSFDLYRVTGVKSAPSGCSGGGADDSYWGLWTIQTETFINNIDFPSNGIIFVEDNLWVDGKIDTASLTIASARFPDVDSTRTSITINSNLEYTNYDGSDSIGLIAQRNINIGYGSVNDIRIDAAIIAQNGRVGRYFYNSSCGSSYMRNSVTLLGMLASNARYGFSWTCSGTYCSGYKDRFINYDSHLLYNPPPNFPLTSDRYETISWEEVRN